MIVEGLCACVTDALREIAESLRQSAAAPGQGAVAVARREAEALSAEPRPSEAEAAVAAVAATEARVEALSAQVQAINDGLVPALQALREERALLSEQLFEEILRKDTEGLEDQDTVVRRLVERYRFLLRAREETVARVERAVPNFDCGRGAATRCFKEDNKSAATGHGAKHGFSEPKRTHLSRPFLLSLD